jgi:hypothetical protein
VLALLYVALGWWRVLRRRGRATGTVTARPRAGSRLKSGATEVTFEVGGTAHTFRPSIVTSGDAGKLDVGAKVPVAYDPSDPASADLAEPWRLYGMPVIVSVLYLALAWYVLFGS